MIYLVTRNNELFESDEYKIIGVDESLSLLNSLRIVGLDTETSGLDCHTGKLLSVQLRETQNQLRRRMTYRTRRLQF